MMFDEGTATTGFNSCCGWNPSAGPRSAGGSRSARWSRTADGSVVGRQSIANYNQGNRGHGTSIFGVLTNQPCAPKHVVDSDAYSHISFVRTLQDMFGLADPGDDWSYMNRSKYTERVHRGASAVPARVRRQRRHALRRGAPDESCVRDSRGLRAEERLRHAARTAGRPRRRSAQRLGASSSRLADVSSTDHLGGRCSGLERRCDWSRRRAGLLRAPPPRQPLSRR